MRQGREVAQALGNSALLGAELKGACRCCQGILHVVGTLDAHVADTAEHMVAPREAHDEQALGIDPGSVGLVGKRLAPQHGNAHAAGTQALPYRLARLVVAEHGEVVAGHVGEKLLLGLGVSLKAAVPLHVVGRDIEQHAHMRGKLLRTLKLEAGQLGDKHLVGRAVFHTGNRRQADVAHRAGGHAGGAQKLTC